MVPSSAPITCIKKGSSHGNRPFGFSYHISMFGRYLDQDWLSGEFPPKISPSRMATPKIRRFELSYLNSGFESEHDSNSYGTEMFDRIRLFWFPTGQNRPSREFPYQFRLVEDSPLKVMFSHSFFPPYPTNSYSEIDQPGILIPEIGRDRDSQYRYRAFLN